MSESRNGNSKASLGTEEKAAKIFKTISKTIWYFFIYFNKH